MLTIGTWATACGWAFSLAMIDGWQRGFAGRLTTRDEYLSQVPGINDIAATLRTFASRILDSPARLLGHARLRAIRRVRC